jgi:hypothetical protein
VQLFEEFNNIAFPHDLTCRAGFSSVDVSNRPLGPVTRNFVIKYERQYHGII